MKTGERKSPPGGPADGEVHAREARVTAAAILVLCVGMALTTAGVVVPGLFLPGVILIMLGLLGTAAAAAMRLVTG
jgi:hypothetical protein